ncbi:hypothetical protein RchiOBHm_Chr1g0326001 [Rosa chinensis]|uniref:Uncharacterized protein n=1 Tax=Rosa chinensis TaxID=74649 RepID=A0A2P6SA65_ROSCH|nr:hypothetical protein RchiOBHm_Chr1g0326001 [Rosa chinensis]
MGIPQVSIETGANDHRATTTDYRTLISNSAADRGAFEENANFSSGVALEENHDRPSNNHP